MAAGETLEGTRLLEALASISIEIYQDFKPFFQGDTADEKGTASMVFTMRLQYLA